MPRSRPSGTLDVNGPLTFASWYVTRASPPATTPPSISRVHKRRARCRRIASRPTLLSPFLVHPDVSCPMLTRSKSCGAPQGTTGLLVWTRSQDRPLIAVRGTASPLLEGSVFPAPRTTNLDRELRTFFSDWSTREENAAGRKPKTFSRSRQTTFYLVLRERAFQFLPEGTASGCRFRACGRLQARLGSRGHPPL